MDKLVSGIAVIGLTIIGSLAIEHSLGEAILMTIILGIAGLGGYTIRKGIK